MNHSTWHPFIISSFYDSLPSIPLDSFGLCVLNPKIMVRNVHGSDDVLYTCCNVFTWLGFFTIFKKATVALQAFRWGTWARRLADWRSTCFWRILKGLRPQLSCRSDYLFLWTVTDQWVLYALFYLPPWPHVVLLNRNFSPRLRECQAVWRGPAISSVTGNYRIVMCVYVWGEGWWGVRGV